MTNTVNNAPTRELHEMELEQVNGGTSGTIYAVAAAFYKSLAAADDARINSKDGVVTPCRYQ